MHATTIHGRGKSISHAFNDLAEEFNLWAAKQIPPRRVNRIVEPVIDDEPDSEGNIWVSMLVFSSPK